MGKKDVLLAQWLVWHCSRVIRTWNKSWALSGHFCIPVLVSEALQLKVKNQHSD